MKKFSLLILLSLIVFLSCKTGKKQVNKSDSKTSLVTDKLLETAVIYEANIRQYSPEGTFNAFTKDIPVLKELGVKVIWLMPVFPISQTKRKATGDTFVSDIKNPEERKKYLGSYYAVSDYRKVSSDYGTKDDLRKLIDTAHKNGIIVILDWVPNHTGWDHSWIKEHPEYYTKNDEGEITDPLNNDGSSKGWQDVADLDYSNKGLRKAMIADMKYWLTDESIDGFRCDVAGEVPVSFWKEAIPQLRDVKPIFMLAEAWEPELLQGNQLFDMCYGWENHFLMADIAKGKKNVTDWDRYMSKIDTMYEKDDIIMNFTENHDENSWKGTVKQTFGDAAEIMAVLSYMTPGMPLIYSGQEYGLDKQLKFFEKDTIPKAKGKFFSLYQKIGVLKNENTAINGGQKAADYSRISTSSNATILAFSRQKKEATLYFIGNLSNKDQSFTLQLQGHFKSILNDKNLALKEGETLHFKAWEYLILSK